jgi:hypothetical protein
LSNRCCRCDLCAGLVCRAGDRPLTPIEARKKVGEKITVEMTVQAAKDRLESRGEIYLGSEMDFRDEKNFAVVSTKAGAASLPVSFPHRPTTWTSSSGVSLPFLPARSVTGLLRQTVWRISSFWCAHGPVSGSPGLLPVL